MAERFNTLVGLNLTDKRVDPDSWLRSGFEYPQMQCGFKPLSVSHQPRTLHCRVTLIGASFRGLIKYYHFPFFSIFYLHMIFCRFVSSKSVSFSVKITLIFDLISPISFRPEPFWKATILKKLHHNGCVFAR